MARFSLSAYNGHEQAADRGNQGPFMKQDVETLLTSLRTDHRNLSMLLDLLQKETERLEACEEPDFELVHEVMEYMTSYPDTVHHPREDLLYQHILAARSDVDENLQRVESDHEAIAVLGAKLRDDIDSIAAGAFIKRDVIIAELRGYRETLLTHMYWEERELFALADELQDDKEWSSIDLGGADDRDPLFGSRVDRKFRRLMAGIQQRIVWDNQQYFV
jgi:hemerythrin-like domain-containing protein